VTRQYKLFIQDILDAIIDIEEFIGDMDYEIVWEVIKKWLPEIKPLIEQILEDLEE
jgi:uncharacterized protein with HEPN domain